MRRARTNAFFRKKNAPRADKCIFQSHFCNLRSKTLSQRIFKTHFKCDLRRQTHFKCDLSIKSYFFAPWKSGKFAYACKRIFHASHMSKVAGNVFFRGRVGDEPGSELRTMFAFVLSFGPCRPASKLAVWVGRSVYVYFWFAGQRWGHRLSEAARQTNATQNRMQKHHCSLQSKYASRFNTKNERWGCCPT